MTNTLIVIAEKLASNYRTNMMEHLYSDMDSYDPRDFAGDLIQLGNELRELLNSNDRVALSAFRSQFKAGSTMMMLDSKDFDRLEAWDNNKEDFRIAIFRQDNTAVGIVENEDINY